MLDVTITYDPKHPAYLDEADAREELTRVFDLCHGCRLCVDYCPTFPTLFELIERHDDRDAGLLTPAEQDHVVDGCYQCKRCAVDCPYTPALHERALDFPRLVLRAQAMRHSTGQKRLRQRSTTHVMARMPFVSRLVGAFAKRRFSTWFERRPKRAGATRRAAVTVFPTCVVEYQAAQIGKDLVNVFERNGIGCSLTGARCCGAPWLHAGDLARFIRVAEDNVKTLAAEIRGGGDIVVPQPTCGYVLKQDYVAYVVDPRLQADARFVAEHTHDAAAYLMRRHATAGTELDTDFSGPVPPRVTHVTYDGAGASRALIELTGAAVRLVQPCSGVDVAQETPAAVVTGDCHLANTAIAEQTGAMPLHTLSLIARAYGIGTD